MYTYTIAVTKLTYSQCVTTVVAEDDEHARMLAVHSVQDEEFLPQSTEFETGIQARRRLSDKK